MVWMHACMAKPKPKPISRIIPGFEPQPDRSIIPSVCIYLGSISLSINLNIPPLRGLYVHTYGTVQYSYDMSSGSVGIGGK